MLSLIVSHTVSHLMLNISWFIFSIEKYVIYFQGVYQTLVHIGDWSSCKINDSGFIIQIFYLSQFIHDRFVFDTLKNATYYIPIVRYGRFNFNSNTITILQLKINIKLITRW